VGNSVDILMHVLNGDHLPPAVIEGLARQHVPYRLWVARTSSECPADARNHMKRYGDADLVLMLDGDMVLPEGGLRRMVDFLDERPDFGAVGLCEHRDRRFYRVEEWLNAHHVDMSCVLFRRGTLDRITFADRHNASRVGRERLAGACDCANACHDIRALGQRIGFVPEVYVDHLDHPPRSR